MECLLVEEVFNPWWRIPVYLLSLAGVAVAVKVVITLDVNKTWQQLGDWRASRARMK